MGWSTALGRLEGIDWTPRHEQTRIAIGQLKVYLERQVHWARALDRLDDWPVVDIADVLGAPSLPASAEHRLRVLTEAHALSSFTELACRGIVRWTLLPEERWRHFGIPVPWEPLLVAFELAGSIRREHRFLQAGLASIALDRIRP